MDASKSVNAGEPAVSDRRLPDPDFEVRLATNEREVRAAQRLRYDVFVTELGATGASANHDLRLEQDRFDPYFDHLLLLDQARGETVEEQVVGTYRVMRPDQAKQAGQFYSADEYDLRVLLQSGKDLLELGRSCVSKAYRGGQAMYLLWTALGAYAQQHEIDILFGVASFHGTDPQSLSQPLSYLHHYHLAPPELRVIASGPASCAIDILPKHKIQRREAMIATPALIKAYLRLGGFVGSGAYVDHDFNTVDVCLLLDVARMNESRRRIYEKHA